MNVLPQDPMMLLSVLNMKLRDFYPSLDALCEDMGIQKETVLQKMREIQYEYYEELNRFV